MDNQEYYHRSVGHCMIWGDVVDKPDHVIVSENSDYGQLIVVRRKDLQKKEDTWEFKQAQKRADELRLITAKAQEQFDKLSDRLVDDAIRALSSRMKFNIAFGQGGDAAPYALMLSQKLEELIKEKAPEIINEAGKES